MPIPNSQPAAVVARLSEATNAHDVDAIVACFAADYDNITPAHPGRSFVGNQQVRRNWTRILAAIPDVSTEIVASVVAGDTVWTEWEHRGTRPDGSRHLMRGVIVFAIHDELITTARFFLEPVDDTGHDMRGAADNVDSALGRQLNEGDTPR